MDINRWMYGTTDQSHVLYGTCHFTVRVELCLLCMATCCYHSGLPPQRGVNLSLVVWDPGRSHPFFFSPQIPQLSSRASPAPFTHPWGAGGPGAHITCPRLKTLNLLSGESPQTSLVQQKSCRTFVQTRLCSASLRCGKAAGGARA